MAYSTLQKIKIRLGQYHMNESDEVEFDQPEKNPLIEQLIEQVNTEITQRRNYPASYKEEQIYADLKKYENNIINIVVYDCSQAGEAYMQSYTENGVSRNWISRDDLFAGIFPYVKAI